jgi:hypothetical protein
MLFRAHAIDHVVLFHGVVAAGNNSLLSAFDGYYTVFAVVIDSGREQLTYYLGALTHVDHA